MKQDKIVEIKITERCQCPHCKNDLEIVKSINKLLERIEKLEKDIVLKG
jgi:hypothetical protein